ncbi:ATP-grasp domain protein [Leptospira inadai serovar Lyme str. 10]|uniref:ATP-grasp domain protein n=3 Tax=Leptospira inadai TaxID=29506 RepID=V6HEA4_9LEPT|nr:ATP-grasp domain protein [Leptospira inadai serovar Lyme str. 10]PNV73574.1 biotin carboxylase [Leptospira inadai serovar Lyme]
MTSLPEAGISIREMKKKGYFLSVGAGKNQLPLIRACKNLGLDVISVDRNDKAPGFPLSNLKIIESTHEYRRIHRAVSENPLPIPILGVGTRSYGKATYTTAYLAEKLKLRYASTDSVLLFSDKHLLKSVASEKGIRVPRDIPFSELRAKEKSIPYPWIAKPSQGSGKQGVRLLTSDAAASNFLSTISPHSKKGSVKSKKNADVKNQPEEKWILEEFIPGLECTVLGLVSSDEFHLVSLTLKETSEFPPFLEVAHRLPFPKSEITGEIIMLCRSIVKATGLKNCPFVAEFKLNTDGEPVLIEAAPEVGGEYLADVLVPGYMQYDYFSNFIKLLIGEPFELPPSMLRSSPNKKAQIRFEIPPKGISILKQVSEFRVKSREKVLFERTLHEVGTKLDTSVGNEVRPLVLGIKITSSQPEEAWNESIKTRFKADYDVR